MNRQHFLKNLGLTILGAVGLGGLVKSAKSAALVLRPPGARQEEDFIRQCIKCGLCVQACPYNTLHLARPGAAAAPGTPTFIPRQIPCYLCEDIPCTRACPSAALQKETLLADPPNEKTWDVNKTRIGVAVIDRGSCLAYGGIQCDACYRACPLIDNAIRLKYEENTFTGHHASLLPVVNPDTCTGCGLCEHVCVTEKAAIMVLPASLAKGQVGEHYIRSWRKNDARRLDSAQEPELKASPKNPLDYLNQDLPDEQ